MNALHSGKYFIILRMISLYFVECIYLLEPSILFSLQVIGF